MKHCRRAKNWNKLHKGKASRAKNIANKQLDKLRLN